MTPRGQGRGRPRAPHAVRRAGAADVPDRGRRGVVGPPDRAPGRAQRPGSTTPAARRRSSTSASSTSSATSSTPPRCAGRSSWSAATATSLQDQHNTSTTRNVLMPGPEIQAERDRDRARGLPAARRCRGGSNVAADRRRRRAPRRSPRCGCGSCPAVADRRWPRVAALLVGAQVAFQRTARSSRSIYPLVAGVAGHPRHRRRSTA